MEKTVFVKAISLGFTVLELSKLLMHEFYHQTLKQYWKHRMQIHDIDTDSFVRKLDANNEELANVSQQNKDEFDFSQLDKSHELLDPINKNFIDEMKIETCSVLVLDTFTALQSKSNRMRYIPNGVIQDAKQKGIQKAPECEDYVRCLIPEPKMQQIIQFDQTYTTSRLKNKTDSIPVDEKRMYLNPTRSLPWDEIAQKGYCPCLYCL